MDGSSQPAPRPHWLTCADVGRLDFGLVSHNFAAVTLGNIIGSTPVGLANRPVYLRLQ